MELTEFVSARLDKDEAVARCTCDGCGGGWCDPGCPTCSGGDRETRDWRAVATVEAHRKIVALHQEWPVLIQTEPKLEPVDSTDLDEVRFRMTQQFAWATNREYVARFGTEPPTTPALRALASIWSDHPDYDPAWEA